MKTFKQFTMMAAVAVAGLAFASTVRAETPAAAAAKADIQKTLGFVPQFLSRLPE